MNTKVVPVAALIGCFFVCLVASHAQAQSNITVRVMAANLTGNSQTYGDSQIRIFQGLKPDIICIQEFKYGGNTDPEIRSFVDTAFGPNFQYTRETNASYDIPNGVISRYPILAAGSWDDLQSPNRGFAWAQIDLPGSNALYAVSVHLLTSDSGTRGQEAAELKAIIATNFPANAWIVVAGDMNTDSRTESAINTLTSFLSDNPIPADQVSGGDPDTNMNRNKPYDYVLPSFSFANRLTNVVIGSYSFPNGLVFDSRVYTNLPDVSPVLLNDSANGQHMAVLKDFQINSENTTNAPLITTQPQSQTNSLGATATFAVVANGTGPLSYQWRHTTTNLPGATASSLSLPNIQVTDAGNYSVVITNLVGSITSSNAFLAVVTTPLITNQPQSQVVSVGDNVTFTVGATGPGPLGYLWRFTGTNLPGATSSSFTRTNAQLTDAGNYIVVVTNASGSVTSAVAVLTVNGPVTGGVIAQWNFNSIPPDGMTTTGTSTPSTGSGTAALFGGTTATFATGDTSLDPAGTTDNSGWNTTTYPAQNTGNKTRGLQFNVSTLGRQNIVVTWSSQSSNTGNKYARLQYTTNGTTYFDFPTAATNGLSFNPKTNNLSSFPGVNHNPNFAFRIVSEFESTVANSGSTGYVAANPASTYNTTGTMRYDMVTVIGDTITVSNPPASAPILADVTLAGNYIHFVLNGSSGSNYIVQAATDLSLSNWVSLQTNSAPLFFSETNQFQQRFYRGLVAP
ncbi:MAG: immunoglobulin domain-containing protein [Verrucomicrobiota bacterium]